MIQKHDQEPPNTGGLEQFSQESKSFHIFLVKKKKNIGIPTQLFVLKKKYTCFCIHLTLRK